jgi:hypothetical protein
MDCSTAHRVTGGDHPPPVPTERGVRISRTTLFGNRFTAPRVPASPGTGDAVWVAAAASAVDLVEGGPGEVFAGPAAAAQHPVPVTLHGPVHLEHRADVSADAVVGIVAAQGGVDLADLVADPMMPDLPHQLLQRHEAAP